MRKKGERFQGENGGHEKSNKPARIERLKVIFFEHAVEETIKCLKAIEIAMAKLASLGGNCEGCAELGRDLAERSINEAQRKLSLTGPRVIRVAKRRLTAVSAN